ncbi:hypothetical protein [Enhygromyxa salina]|uniref:Uncharacterized protein n=1 Tax=Enhygromyxa salina TaxID=215803 RepID=A0A2S9XQ59_9BACT|nr:hypothetical protein [Enhygromyxa salina]PRP94880.1 hypothetical protein ENSA7_77030 [Enhygromyxa salina]
MDTDFDPSVAPPWLVRVRETVYLAARRWWLVVPGVILLGRACGLMWGGACLLGLFALAAILVSPFALGVLIAFVSRARQA